MEDNLPIIMTAKHRLLKPQGEELGHADSSAQGLQHSFICNIIAVAV
jgi:hypothetical protein